MRPETESEHLELSRINSKGGIQFEYIVDNLRAFGRIPRHGINLLSDQHGLVTGESDHHVQQMADSLRIEAQKHLTSMSIDATLRRSLLRKTTSNIPITTPPGSVVAYWKWTARSGRKRGGFRLARLLGTDPNQKSICVQSGTNTIRLAPHQLLSCSWLLGFAGDNIKSGQVVDESIPEPPIPDEDDDYEPDELPLNVHRSDLGALEAPEFSLVVPEKSAVEQTSTEDATQTGPYLPSSIQSQHQHQTNTYKHYQPIQRPSQCTFTNISANQHPTSTYIWI